MQQHDGNEQLWVRCKRHPSGTAIPDAHAPPQCVELPIALRHVSITHVIRSTPGGQGADQLLPLTHVAAASTCPSADQCQLALVRQQWSFLPTLPSARPAAHSNSASSPRPAAQSNSAFVARRVAPPPKRITNSRGVDLRAPQHGDRHGLSPAL